MNTSSWITRGVDRVAFKANVPFGYSWGAVAAAHEKQVPPLRRRSGGRPRSG
jgi:hypothetical protein